MALNPKQIADDHAAYAAAYNDEPSQPGGAPAEGSPAEEAAETPAQEAQEEASGQDMDADDTADAGTPGGQTPTEAQGDTAATPDAEPRDAGDTPASAEGADAPTAAADGQGPIDIAKETQRLKSWEGRLKKAQAELDAAKAAMGAKAEEATESPTTEAIEEVADQANASGNTDLSQAADKAADQIESGKLTPEAAMQQLAEDFGDDFVNLISTVAQHFASQAGASAASEKVAKVSKSIDDIVGHLSDSAARQHFKEIQAAHPDFHEVANSPQFQAFVEEMPAGEQAQAHATLKGGSSDQINALLSKFKEAANKKAPTDVPTETTPADHDLGHQPAQAKPDPKVSAQMDAAEGVRSKGAVKLPEQPSGNQSYEDTWRSIS